MIDQILNATRQEDWRKASTLLYKHWSQTCPNVYAITGEPWDQPQPNDDKIGNTWLEKLFGTQTKIKAKVGWMIIQKLIQI